MLKVCLTHDIDRTEKSYQYLTKAVISSLRGDIGGIIRQVSSLRQKRPYWKFSDFIEIENSFDVKSTIFFLNESIKLRLFVPNTYQLALGRYEISNEHIVHMIKWLDSNGWEIGVHGSYNSFKSPEMLKNEKAILESIVNHEIIGIRQHYLNLNNKTWEYQKTAGFQYDSSWGMKSDIGFKDLKYLPFHPFQDKFMVIPLVLMDTCFMEQDNRWKKLDRIIEQCEEKEGILVINFHQHVFNEIDFPGFKAAYIKIIETCLKKNSKFYTLAQVASDK